MSLGVWDSHDNRWTFNPTNVQQSNSTQLVGMSSSGNNNSSHTACLTGGTNGDILSSCGFYEYSSSEDLVLCQWEKFQ